MRGMVRVVSVGLAMGLLMGVVPLGPAAAADPSASPALSADPSPGLASPGAPDPSSTAATASPVAGDTPPALATPEDAVREYLAGVAEADMDRVLGTAAIDDIAQGFDLSAYVQRLRVWIPFQVPAPATDPFLVELNRAQQAYQLLGQTRMLVYSLLTTEDLDGTAVTSVDAAWAQAFIDQLDLERLSGLEVVDIRFPEPGMETDERFLTNAASQAAIYGADELTERVAELTFEGARYRVGFTLVRFGERWRIASQSSAFSGLSPTGVAERVTSQ